MSVLIGTNAGCKLAIDVALDNTAGRSAAAVRHFGAFTTWTPSDGSVTAIRDGSEKVEIEVTVTGPFNGTVHLMAPGSKIMASSPPVSVPMNQRAIILFGMSRAHAREIALAGPGPTVSNVKEGSVFMLGEGALSSAGQVIRNASVVIGGQGSLSATAEP